MHCNQQHKNEKRVCDAGLEPATPDSKYDTLSIAPAALDDAQVNLLKLHICHTYRSHIVIVTFYTNFNTKIISYSFTNSVTSQYLLAPEQLFCMRKLVQGIASTAHLKYRNAIGWQRNFYHRKYSKPYIYMGSTQIFVIPKVDFKIFHILTLLQSPFLDCLYGVPYEDSRFS